jgi:IS66 Orf2 like protein
MIPRSPQSRILLATEPVDCRTGIDGLAAGCRQRLGDNPLEGAVDVLRHRSGPSLTLLLSDGQGYWLSPKRQNTSQAASPAGQVTITDPTHPLYGRTLPLLRVHSTGSKARLVVQLPDGRVQWIPRAVTDLAASAAVTLPHALIAVPTLLPLAQLVCAMLTGKEDIHHETVHALIVPLRESPGAPTIVEPPRRTCTAATGPMPLRPDSADVGYPDCCSQGEQL